MEGNKDTDSSWYKMKVKLPTVNISTDIVTIHIIDMWMYDASKKDLNFYPYLLKKNKLW